MPVSRSSPPRRSTPKVSRPKKVQTSAVAKTKKTTSSSPKTSSDRVSLSKEGAESQSDRVKNLQDAWSAEEPGSPDSHFQYEKQNYQDLTEAQAYSPLTEAGSKRMTGTEANDQINNDYHQINQNMQRYLAGDPNGERLPDTTDWTSFGKYASREAGEQIRNTEDVLQAMTGDAKAATDLMRNGITPTNITQGALVGTDIVNRALGGNAGNLIDAAADTAKGDPTGPIKGVQSAQNASADAGEMGAESLFKINSGLVKGNTEIHRNIAPAYDAFLDGEANGKGGMESLKEAGYYKGSDKDKQGFVSGAFADYQKARETGLEAQTETDPAKKKQLLAQRQELMERGNLMIGMQEQMEILQKPGIFEDKDMQRVIGASSGTMNLTDANGRHDLLPEGGQWTDFQTRMGLKTVKPGTEGAIPVKNNSGKTTHYLPDPSQKGTIVDYFTQNAAGEQARRLNQGAPRPVETVPTSETGQSLDGLGQGINNRDASQIVGNSLALGPRVASDLSETGSNTLRKSAEPWYDQGYERIQRGQQRGGVGGTADRVVGSVEMLEGGLRETTAGYARSASDGLEKAGDHVERVADSYDNGVTSPFHEDAVWWVGRNPFRKGGMLEGFGF